MKKLLCVAFLLLSINGCGDDDNDVKQAADADDSDTSSSDAGLDSGSSSGKETTANIDESGGSVELKEISIEVPSGALSKTVEIRIKVVEPPVPIPDEYEQASDVYECQPHGLEFDKPVEMEIRYTDIPNESFVVLHLSDDKDDSWETVDSAVFDDGIARFEAQRFSYKTVAYRVQRTRTKPDAATADAGTTDSGGDTGDVDASGTGVVDAAVADTEAVDASGQNEIDITVAQWHFDPAGMLNIPSLDPETSSDNVALLPFTSSDGRPTTTTSTGYVNWLTENNWSDTTYLSCSLQALNGYTIHLKSLTFSQSKMAEPGPDQWILRSSDDGFSSDIASETVPTFPTFAEHTVDLTGIEVGTSPVEFRWYTSDTTTATVSWGLDDVVFVGDVVAKTSF